MILKIDEQLKLALRPVLDQAAASAGSSLPDAACHWEMPKDPTFGDLSNSSAFKLAAIRRLPPAKVAEELAKSLMERCRQDGLGALVERIEVKAGFLNVFLSQQALAQVLDEVLKQGGQFGTCAQKQAPKINVEFVSANPTGPLSVAHGRQAAVGDVLVRLLRSQGFEVTAEYYLNDEGRQVEMLGRSLRVRYLQALGKPEPFPEDGYHGQYLVESAAALKQAHGDKLADKPLDYFMSLAMEEQLSLIKRDLEYFGLAFDQWSSQQWLRTSGKIDVSLKSLKDRGSLYDKEDATWFASTQFGDDKDRVVRKRDGELTYLAPDIAYHQWKFERGFDTLINLWGPDHHGYIARIKAAVSALGFAPEKLCVRIVQLVTLTRSGKPVPMSKRQGEFVTFREILEEVGVDATRFFYVMRTMESHLDFDLELAKAQSQENPVYYVQYAHARICSILAKAESKDQADFALLAEPEERLLIRTLFQYPVVLRLCANALEPQGITVYLRKLAEAFHVFYTKHRVITENASLSSARLSLIRATQQVLANGLAILGVRAPQRM